MDKPNKFVEQYSGVARQFNYLHPAATKITNPGFDQGVMRGRTTLRRRQALISARRWHINVQVDAT